MNARLIAQHYKFASEGFTICTHTTSLSRDLLLHQEKLPRNRRRKKLQGKKGWNLQESIRGGSLSRMDRSNRWHVYRRSHYRVTTHSMSVLSSLKAPWGIWWCQGFFLQLGMTYILIEGLQHRLKASTRILVLVECFSRWVYVMLSLRDAGGRGISPVTSSAHKSCRYASTKVWWSNGVPA